MHRPFKLILWSKKIVVLPAPTDNRISYRPKQLLPPFCTRPSWEQVVYSRNFHTQNGSRIDSYPRSYRTFYTRNTDSSKILLVKINRLPALPYYPHRSCFVSKSTAYPGPFSIYEQPKYKPNLTLILTLIQTLILTQILTLKPTWVDATIRSHFGCSYIEKEPLPAGNRPENTVFVCCFKLNFCRRHDGWHNAYYF